MREASECLGIFVCLCLSVLVQSGWGRQHVCVRVCVHLCMCEMVVVITHVCL